MGCQCKSYNQPEDYQAVESATLSTPHWVQDAPPTVLVDACVADQVQALWGARIWTLSTCCGHNGRFPRHVVVDKDDATRARNLLQSQFGRPLVVQFWVLATA